MSPRQATPVVCALVVFNVAMVLLLGAAAGGNPTGGATGVVAAAGLGLIPLLPGWVLVDLVLLILLARPNS